MADEKILDLGHLKVERFRQCDGEDVWLGTVIIFRIPHHFQAIKVEKDSDGIWRGTNDPYDKLEDVYGVYDYPPMTTEIPGLEGDFVILIHPHGD